MSFSRLFSVACLSVATIALPVYSDEPQFSELETPNPVSPPLELPVEAASGTFRATQPALKARALPTLPLTTPPNTFWQTPADIGGWMREVVAARPKQAKIRALGKTPQGRVIYALELSPPGKTPWQVKRLAVICRQHGNEPEATASGTRMVYEYLTSTAPNKKKLAARTALLIVPIANPDGAAVYKRRTAQNIDMNRDWMSKRSMEVRALNKWLTNWKPHMIVDNHQWLPREKTPPPMAEASGGALAQRAAQLMSRQNAHRGFYLAARSRYGSATLAHRYWGQRAKVPAILLETRHRPSVPGARDQAITQAVTAIWAAAQSLG